MKTVIIGTKRASLGEVIGKGGEGTVFKIIEHSNVVAKIYNAKIRHARKEKIQAMVRNSFAQQTDVIAFPKEIVLNMEREFLGFTMKLFSGYRPIHYLYSPKSRLKHFPDVDFRLIIRTAINVARAIGKAHQIGCIVGDINHSGILVSSDARIALIDADSFQFNYGQMRFPCEVGVPDFLPPEIQGKNLSRIMRTAKHDFFGLAIVIFQLLFMGRHPYAGIYKGTDITSIGQAIMKHKFAFSLEHKSSSNTEPPPGALTLDLFPKCIRKSFELAFGLHPKMRPPVLHWINSLISLEKMLKQCSNVPNHFYPGSSQKCIWCYLPRTGSGVDMFPYVSNIKIGEPTDCSATERAIQEFLKFNFPKFSNLVPSEIANRMNISDAMKAAISKQDILPPVGWIVLAGSVVGSIYDSSLCIIWAIAFYIGISLIRYSDIDVSYFCDAYDTEDKALQRELHEFIKRNGLGEISNLRGNMDGWIKSYRNSESKLKMRLSQLRANNKRNQLNAFLNQFLIRDADIPGIGPERTTKLLSFGIETAADISSFEILRISGFGNVITNNLVSWRNKIESKFRYKLALNLQDTARESKIWSDYQLSIKKIRINIRNGILTLQKSRQKINNLPSLVRKDNNLLSRMKSWSVAKSDLQKLNKPVPNSNLACRELF